VSSSTRPSRIVGGTSPITIRSGFELNAQSGRADYVLMGPKGPLAVLEAKREDRDPYDAKVQARGYAQN